MNRGQKYHNGSFCLHKFEAERIGFQFQFICKIFIAYIFLHRYVAIFLLAFFGFSMFLIRKYLLPKESIGLHLTALDYEFILKCILFNCFSLPSCYIIFLMVLSLYFSMWHVPVSIVIRSPSFNKSH